MKRVRQAEPRSQTKQINPDLARQPFQSIPTKACLVCADTASGGACRLCQERATEALRGGGVGRGAAPALLDSHVVLQHTAGQMR